eukprot:gene3826-4084_t
MQTNGKPKDKQEEYVEALKKGGVVSCSSAVTSMSLSEEDQQTAKSILETWNQTGAQNDPNQLRKLFLKQSLVPITASLVQLLFDFGAAYSIFISSTFFALGPPFWGQVALVYLLDFLAIYFAIGIFFDVVTLTSILITTAKLGTAPMAFYDAVKAIAGPAGGPAEGLKLVEKAKAAVSAVKVAQALDAIAVNYESLMTLQHEMDMAKDERKPPALEDLLESKDYIGAITLLNFKLQGSRNDIKLMEWLAYAHYHNGEHDKALAVYQELLRQEDPDPLYLTYSAACYFYIGLTKQAVEAALQGPRCPLATRILFHCAQRQGDEDTLMAQHSNLTDSLDDQLSLAALHFNRGHYQEATDMYKSLLLDHRELLALNVYVALCYAKLDYYDVSQEILQVYLNSFPASPLAVNHKACNTFRLSNGKAAEAELKGLVEASGWKHTEHDLIRHNVVVFRGGEGAMQVLPALGDVLSEAALNLVIHHLRKRQLNEAHALVKDLTPKTPQEYILKAVVGVSLGQASGSQEQLKQAQQHFQLVGSSASECDTIPGRQAMASCFFLLKQFEDVLVFLNASRSIKSYFPNDDSFAWNYGLALAATGKYSEAEGALSGIRSEALRSDPVYVGWMARCLIMSCKPGAAWELYQTWQQAATGREEGYTLLQRIANDFYRMGAFYHAAKAFDVLERLDPNPEYYEAKRGAAVGVFQMIIACKEQPGLLAEVVELLQGSAQVSSGTPNSTTTLQVEQITRVMRQWAKMNGIAV